MITIRMPKGTLSKWLAALRSGKYKQTIDVLYDRKTGGFCCLGVLQHVVDGEVETYGRIPCQLPSRAWLSKNGVEFRQANVIDGQCRSPYLPALNTFADVANDLGVDFDRIADAIEACSEGY